MKIPNLSDIPDLSIVPEGEYDITIIGVKDITAGTGRPGTLFICKINDQENAKNLMHTIWYPMDSDDKSSAEDSWRRIKEFLNSIGIDTDDEFEISELKGTEFTALLGTEVYNGEDKNKIVRIV